ncbi:MAG: hypothetical protein HOL85_12155 [Rhodospirillaceae bacterium]|nr:hypothetical protein [Rhodospirillaceae bacterium]
MFFELANIAVNAYINSIGCTSNLIGDPMTWPTDLDPLYWQIPAAWLLVGVILLVTIQALLLADGSLLFGSEPIDWEHIVVVVAVIVILPAALPPMCVWALWGRLTDAIAEHSGAGPLGHERLRPDALDKHHGTWDGNRFQVAFGSTTTSERLAAMWPCISNLSVGDEIWSFRNPYEQPLWTGMAIKRGTEIVAHADMVHINRVPQSNKNTVAKANDNRPPGSITIGDPLDVSGLMDWLQSTNQESAPK